jgi:hypothetical protein
MNKTANFYVWRFLLVSMTALMLVECNAAIETSTPTSDGQALSTYIHHIPPSDVTEYTHYISKAFEFHLEFDYPSSWWFEERVDEVGIPSLLFEDRRFLTIPTPIVKTSHPEPNDFGYIHVWSVPESDQTPEAKIESLKNSYNQTSWMKVLRDYKSKIGGYDAVVLEFQINDSETSPSLMFARRTYFMINGQLQEVFFYIAEKDRGGEFEQGYDYFFNSLKIVP